MHERYAAWGVFICDEPTARKDSLELPLAASCERLHGVEEFGVGLFGGGGWVRVDILAHALSAVLPKVFSRIRIKLIKIDKKIA